MSANVVSHGEDASLTDVPSFHIVPPSHRAEDEDLDRSDLDISAEHWEDYGTGDESDISSASAAVSAGRTLYLSQSTPRINGFPAAGNAGSVFANTAILEHLDELNGKIQKMESEIDHLNQDQRKSTQLQSRLQEENQALTRKVTDLEEELHDVESEKTRQLEDERQKFASFLERQERGLQDELELLRERLQAATVENQLLKSDVQRLRADLSASKQARHEALESLRRAEQRQADCESERRALELTLANASARHDRHSAEQDQHVALLGQELERLRAQQGGGGGGSSGGGLQERLATLSDELRAERARAADLDEQVDELRCQLLNRSVEEGRSLLESTAFSLADELEALPRDEVLEKLREQTEANQKLRDYIDRIVLNIMESNPALLEIKM